MITMKLLVDSSPPCPRVVYAEAGRDAVNLFSRVTESVKLLGKEPMVGCIGNLYTSVEKLDDPYTNTVLRQVVTVCGYQRLADCRYVWSGSVTQEAKGLVYTVTDDLKIFPMSNISSIALLNTVAVRDLGALQERTVQVGYKEGMEILMTSLQSKTVLTDVFLAKKTFGLTDLLGRTTFGR